MDSEVSVMLHCAPTQGFEEHQVQVEISSRYRHYISVQNLVSHHGYGYVHFILLIYKLRRFSRRSVPEIEKHIEAVWNERVTKEPWLFNGAKFRLHSAHLSTTHPQTSTNFCTMAGDTAAQTINSTKSAEGDEQLGNCSALNRISLHCGEGERAPLTINARSKKSICCRETVGEPQKDARHSEANGAILRLQLGLTCYKDFLGTNWSQEAGNLQQRGRLEVGDPQALLAQPLGVGAVLLTSDGKVVMLRRSQRVAEAAGLLDIPGGHPEPKVM